MRRFESPDEAEAAFYDAFLATDLALMGAVWTEEPAPVCVHPGGDLLQGRTAVLRSWSEIFTGAERPDLRYRVIQRTQREDLAVHLTEERIRPRGSSQSHARILATNLFQRTAAGWRLSAHHASLPLIDRTAKRDGAKSPSPQIH
jgi:ketosteroid isomerase-like protein